MPLGSPPLAENLAIAFLRPSLNPSGLALSQSTSFAPWALRRWVSLPFSSIIFLSLTMENSEPISLHAPQSLLVGQGPLCKTVTLRPDHPFSSFSSISATRVLPTLLWAPDTVIILMGL